MKKIGVVIALFYGVLLVMGQDYTPVYEPDACPYFMQQAAEQNDATIACGYLHVPEDRNDIDNSLKLELFVVQIDAVESNDNAPFVYLEGGPGGAATYSYFSWFESRVHQTYDIILIDQRGTGLSYPSLNCYEMDESIEAEAIQACRDRLVSEGIDLNDYSSVENANDIHDLLVALDIQQANIYGSSYGVRLGLTMVRDFPERIRTLMLDAVYPPHVDSLVDQAAYGNQALEQLFNDCAANAACSRAYPDLRQSFYRAIDVMNDRPAEIYDYEYDAYIEMTGDDFANEIFAELYDTTLLPYLPAKIDAYALGDYDYDAEQEAYEIAFDESIESGMIEPDEYDIAAFDYLGIEDINELYDYYDSLSDDEFYDLLDELEDYIYLSPFSDYLDLETIDEAADYIYSLDDDAYAELDTEVTGYYDDDSEGVYYSVECAEEVHFNEVDDIRARADELPDILIIFTDFAIESFDDCAIWNVDQSEEFENEPVVSDIPTLIFSGLYDPITPYQWGDEAQSYLSNSSHFVFPNVGHGALDTQDCATDILLEFLVNPVQVPDGSCVDTLSPPDFYIRP